MVMTDPVADMLARIRNAAMAHKDEVVMPASKLKERIAEILVGEGYVSETTVEGEGKDRRIVSGLKRVSTPGRRVYADKEEIPRVLGGLGIAILSTSRGVLTDRQAKKLGVGGEVLAYVW